MTWSRWLHHSLFTYLIESQLFAWGLSCQFVLELDHWMQCSCLVLSSSVAHLFSSWSDFVETIMANNNYMEQFPADPHRDVSRTPRRQLVGFPRWGPAQRAPLPPPPPSQLSFPPTTPPGFFTPPTTSRPPFSPTQPPLRSPPPATSQSTPTSSPTLPMNPQKFPSRLTPARPFDLRPDPSWQPNEEFYDQTKVRRLGTGTYNQGQSVRFELQHWRMRSSPHPVVLPLVCRSEQPCPTTHRCRTRDLHCPYIGLTYLCPLHPLEPGTKAAEHWHWQGRPDLLPHQGRGPW